MILVESGNRLPTVAVVQHLLNRRLTPTSPLPVDGRFGRGTREAVKDYQRRKRLGSDGTVGPSTWRRLSDGTGAKVIDHVDAADDYHSRPGYTGYDVDLRRVGADPIVTHYMSGSMGSIAARILGRVRRRRSVVLLRLHGHGGPGVMNVSRGTGAATDGNDIIPHVHGDSMSLWSRDWAEVAQHFGPLQQIFSPLGSVELHGCNVAGDVYRNGRRVRASNGSGIGRYLLQRLSQLLQVPVTAGVETQYSHGRAILRFEGRTVTACPNGHESIAAWARGKTLN